MLLLCALFLAAGLLFSATMHCQSWQLTQRSPTRRIHENKIYAMLQELGDIIAYVVANRGDGGEAPAAGGADAGSGSDSEADSDNGAAELNAAGSGTDSGASAPETDAAAAAGGGSRKAKKGPRPLQTFVFSATLTLPQSLRRRLRKGEAWT